MEPRCRQPCDGRPNLTDSQEAINLNQATKRKLWMPPPPSSPQLMMEKARQGLSPLSKQPVPSQYAAASSLHFLLVGKLPKAWRRPCKGWFPSQRQTLYGHFFVRSYYFSFSMHYRSILMMLISLFCLFVSFDPGTWTASWMMITSIIKNNSRTLSPLAKTHILLD